MAQRKATIPGYDSTRKWRNIEQEKEEKVGLRKRNYSQIFYYSQEIQTNIYHFLTFGYIFELILA